MHNQMGLVIKNNSNFTEEQGTWQVRGTSSVLHINLSALSRKSIIPASCLTQWHSKVPMQGHFFDQMTDCDYSCVWHAKG